MLLQIPIARGIPLGVWVVRTEIRNVCGIDKQSNRAFGRECAPYSHYPLRNTVGLNTEQTLKKIAALFICLGAFAVFSGAQSPQKERADLFPVLLDEKWGYINRRGDVVIKPQFDSAGEFKDELAAASVNKRGGYINGTGQFVIQTPPQLILAGS